MPKIRGIKPDYWTDEDIVELSITARLLFIGLWNLACDNGHVPDKPKQIKMRILPADDVDVDALINEIESRGRITRADGTITIKNFAKHQKPHKHWWTTCDLPLCTVPTGSSKAPNNGGTTVEQPLSAVDHGGTTAELNCIDVDVDSDVDVDAAPKTRKKPATRVPEDWKPTDKHIEEAKNLGVSVAVQAAKFINDAKAKDRMYVRWDAAFSNWLINARKWGTEGAASSRQLQPVPAYVTPPAADPENLPWLKDRK